MSDELFFDTNIIVYAYDASEPAKQNTCNELLQKVYKKGIVGIISNQILGELFKGITENIEKPIGIEDAEMVIENIVDSDSWLKINYNQETVKKAILTLKLVKVPFWDAVIAETMKENGIYKIVTENEKDFKRIPGIKVTNPFK